MELRSSVSPALSLCVRGSKTGLLIFQYFAEFLFFVVQLTQIWLGCVFFSMLILQPLERRVKLLSTTSNILRQNKGLYETLKKSTQKIHIYGTESRWEQILDFWELQTRKLVVAVYDYQNVYGMVRHKTGWQECSRRWKFQKK